MGNWLMKAMFVKVNCSIEGLLGLRCGGFPAKSKIKWNVIWKSFKESWKIFKPNIKNKLSQFWMKWSPFRDKKCKLYCYLDSTKAQFKNTWQRLELKETKNLKRLIVITIGTKSWRKDRKEQEPINNVQYA